MGSLFDRVKTGYELPKLDYYLCLKEEPGQVVEAARKALSDAKREDLYGRADDAPESEKVRDARSRLEQAEKSARDASEVIRFRSVGRKTFDMLKRMHPPTQAQQDEAKRMFGGMMVADTNQEKFEPELIAACHLPAKGEEKLTVEQVVELFDVLPSGVVQDMVAKVVELNTQTRSVDAQAK